MGKATDTAAKFLVLVGKLIQIPVFGVAVRNAVQPLKILKHVRNAVELSAGHGGNRSFTGTAVGLAISEGYFGLEDRVADYFPEYCNLLTGRRTDSHGLPVIITNGLGTSRLPVRFCSPSEIVEITLKREYSDNRNGL